MVRHHVDEADTAGTTLAADLEAGSYKLSAPAPPTLTEDTVTKYWDDRVPIYTNVGLVYRTSGLAAHFTSGTISIGAGEAATSTTCPQAATALPAGPAQTDPVLAVWGQENQLGWCSYVMDDICQTFLIGLRALGWVPYVEGMRADILLFIEDEQTVFDHHDRLVASGKVGAIAVRRLVRPRPCPVPCPDSVPGLFAFLQYWGDDVHFWSTTALKSKQKLYSLPIMFFLTYPYAVSWWYPEADIANRALWLPHAASPRFARPLNRSASFAKALLQGSVDPLFYPYRHEATKIAQAGGPVVTQAQLHLTHPGYGKSVRNRAYVDGAAAFGVGLLGCSALQYGESGVRALTQTDSPTFAASHPAPSNRP